MSAETVALVDDHGREVGSAPRDRMRAQNLRHAASAVLLRDGQRRLYVHRRSTDKDWCPGCHDAAAGGVLRPGEDPLANAGRELAEELGVEGVALRPLTTHLYEDATVRCFEHCFEATYDGPVTHADGEVVWGAWLTLGELGGLLADPSWPFVPDTRALLHHLAEQDVRDYAALIREVR